MGQTVLRSDSIGSEKTGLRLPGLRTSFKTVSMVEVKEATAQLSAQERWELYRWLGESEDVKHFRHEELRREITVGLEQAERGDTAPLDVQEIKGDVRRRLAGQG